MKYTKEEIENSKRIFKSATPKQTVDWYVKWLVALSFLQLWLLGQPIYQTLLIQYFRFLGA